MIRRLTADKRRLDLLSIPHSCVCPSLQLLFQPRCVTFSPSFNDLQINVPLIASLIYAAAGLVFLTDLFKECVCMCECTWEIKERKCSAPLWTPPLRQAAKKKVASDFFFRYQKWKKKHWRWGKKWSWGFIAQNLFCSDIKHSRISRLMYPWR